MANVLIIDDEEKLRQLLSRIIRLEGFEVMEAASLAAATKIMEKQSPELILCDVKLTDGNGVEFTKNIKQKHPVSEVILLTAYGNIADGVQAMRNGAFDYIRKGDDNDKIIPLLHRALEKVQLSKKLEALTSKLEKKYSFDQVIGESPAVQQAVELAKKVAATDATVLLSGETGTGKEVFAQAIHYNSSRAAKTFVAVNCSAFSKDLLENELFGHKAGAFTGAIKDSKGLFEEANGGTIFLDEIGEMQPELQAKLLRVLESGEFMKVGDTKTIKVDVRVIAATNRNLQQEMDANQFRTDLYYRLSVFQLPLPALRERKKDIPLLAQHFAIVFAAKTNKQVPSLQKEFVQALQQYNWPGNIRELKNVIERSVILQNNNELTIDSLPFNFLNSTPSHNGFELSAMESAHIKKVLQHAGGNKTETARLLGIGLTTLYRKIDEYKL